MLIVKFLVEYTHIIKGTARWTCKPGDMPTLDRDLAKRLVNELKVAEWVGEGCGCTGVDEAAIMRHIALATRGITQEQEDAAAEAAENGEEAAELEEAPAVSKADGLKGKKGKN